MRGARIGVAPGVLISRFWGHPDRQRPLALSLPLNMGVRNAMFAGVLGVTLSAVGPAAATARRPVTHTVTIEGMQFRPRALSVALGDTVVWVNKDLVAHTATSATAGVFDSKLIAPDKSWRLTIRKKGDLSYICTYHPTMKGTLRVE
jgi:plastocyanin